MREEAFQETLKRRHLLGLLVASILIVFPDLAVSQEPQPYPPATEPPVRLPAGTPRAAPEVRPKPLPPPLRQPADIRQAPELSIVEVLRVGHREIRVGGTVPVTIVVRNSGNRAVTVRAGSRDLFQGTARFAYGSEALVEPGEKATLQLDLVATGSGFSMDGRGGAAICGERSERTIFLLEAPSGPGPSGWRSGNDAGAGAWLPFRDGNNADNERMVSFRFDCKVSFQR